VTRPVLEEVWRREEPHVLGVVRKYGDLGDCEEAVQEAAEAADAARPAEGSGGAADDTLGLLFLCCHPALSRPSQVALCLRAVAGLGVDQIAAAYFVPARTMTQRLTRARTALRLAGARFAMPSEREPPARAAVLDCAT
jgi:predicted RNA polymerase sigma factor